MSSLLRAGKSPSGLGGILEQQAIRQGWYIKSIDPVRALGSNILAESVGADGAKGWFTVPSAPAMPHEILLHHQKIEDPWKPFGMEKCYWVSQKDWIYTVSFRSAKTGIESRLIFKELKGAVDVYLNGALIASHANQAQPLVVDVTENLNPENQLVLHFTDPISARGFKPDKKNAAKDQLKRKPEGSYLGPNPMLYTLGLVGDVVLEHTDGSLIHEIITDFSLNDSYSEGQLKFAVSGKSRFQSVEVQVRLTAADGKQVAQKTVPVRAE